MRARGRVTLRALDVLVEQAEAGLAPLVDHDGDLVTDTKGRGRDLLPTGRKRVVESKNKSVSETEQRRGPTHNKISRSF